MNIAPNPSGDQPVVHATAYVDPTARIIGRVEVGARVFVGPHAVLRADEPDADGLVHPIIIEDECNVQDGVIVHALAGTEVRIGPRTSLAHGAIVHGPCQIGAGSFVGFGAVVFRSQLGRGVFVGSRAVVENVHVPAETFIPALTHVLEDQIGSLRRTELKERNFMADVVNVNIGLAQGYLDLDPEA